MASRVSLLSDDDISRISAFDITDTLDLHDPRFGSTGSMSFDCPTCQMREDQCIGHHASLSLGCYIFHPMIYTDAEKIINSTCISCTYTITSISKFRKTRKCPVCGFMNYADYTIKSDRDKVPKNKSSFPHVAFRRDSEYHEFFLYPHQVARILPAGYVISKIMIPPIYLRTPEDVEWPSDIQKLYERLVQIVRDRAKYEYNNYLVALSSMYVRTVGSTKNEGILGLLSSKDGIFRKIMLGKRVESSARAVISPDPSIMLDEVAVPMIVADTIRITVDVTNYNIVQLRAMATEGNLWWKQYDTCVALPRHVLKGMKFCRKLENGDLVLLNRQPSLSRESIMCFRVRLRTDNYKTFGINPQVVSPFNADFDGDEMNIFFLPHSEEMLELCHLSKNVDVDGKTSLVPVQDVVTGCYLMSLDDAPVSKDVWSSCIMHVDMCITDTPNTTRNLLRTCIPGIYAPITEQDITNIVGNMDGQRALDMLDMLERLVNIWLDDVAGNSPNRGIADLPNEDTADLCYRLKDIDVGTAVNLSEKIENADNNTAVVNVQNIITGCYLMSLHDVPVSETIWDEFAYTSAEHLPRTTHNLLRLCIPGLYPPITKRDITKIVSNIGGQQALDMLYVLQKVVGTWMSVEGVTVPIRSVFTSRTDTAHLSHLSLAPEEFREVCHAIVERELGSTQLLSIIKSGAKGSMIHASHMAVALGQQYIGGKPGVFCTNSYSRGLTPDEFFGHQMAAREGVVSTNVTTALTGYLNRRVCKILADIRTQYNGTAGDKYCISSFSVPD